MTVAYGAPQITPEMYDPLAGMAPLAISTIAWAANVATVQTVANHGLTGTRSLVIIGAVPVYYNGVFNCTVTGLNTFTYPVSPTAYALTTTPPSATWSAGVATITTNVPHGLTGTPFINLASIATHTGYNGTSLLCTITGPSTFTFALASDPGGNGTGGTYAVVISSPASVPGTWCVDSSATFATIFGKGRADGYLRLVLTKGKTYTNTNPYIIAGIPYLYIDFNGASLMNPRGTAASAVIALANYIVLGMQSVYLTNAPGLDVGGGPSGQEFFGIRIKSIKAGSSVVSTMAIPIATITWLGNLVTVTTVIPHLLMVSQNLAIAGCAPSQYNGTFFCTVGAASAFPKSAITSLVWSGGVVTATTTAGHGFANGSMPPLTISGANLTGFNGSFTCTVTGTSTFTYPLAVNPGGTGTGSSWNVQQLSAFTFPLVSNPGAVTITGTFAGVLPVGRVLIQGFNRAQGTPSFPPTCAFQEYNEIESTDGNTGFLVNDTQNEYDDKWPEDSFFPQNAGAPRVLSLNRAPSGDSWDMGYTEHIEVVLSDGYLVSNPNFVNLTQPGFYIDANGRGGVSGGKNVRIVNMHSANLDIGQAENVEMIDCTSGQTEIDKGIHKVKIVRGQYGLFTACLGTDIVEVEDARVGVGVAMGPSRLLHFKRGSLNGAAQGGTVPLFADYTWGSQKSLFEQTKFVVPNIARSAILAFISYTGVFTILSPTRLMLNRADYVSSRIFQCISVGSVFRSWAGLPAFKVSRLPYCEGNQATGDVWIDGNVIYPLASPAFAITSLVYSGGIVTATTTAAHGLVNPSSPTLTIAGADASYNGTFACTVTGTSTFTYALGSTPSGTNTGTWVGNILRLPASLDFEVKDPLFYGQYASQITSVYGNAVASGGNYPMAKIRDEFITDECVRITSKMNIPMRTSNRYNMAIGHHFMISDIVVDVIRAAAASATLALTARDATASNPTTQGIQTLFTSIDLTTVGRRVVGTGSGGNFTNLLGADSNAGGLMATSTNLLEWLDTSAGFSNSALSWNSATISALSWSAGTATAIISSTQTNITSGTYNSGSGLVTLVAPGSTSAPGDTITVAGATGTGSFASINGTFTAGAGTTGNTVTYTIATGLTMTVTAGGNVTRAGHGLTIGGTYYLGFAGSLPDGYNGGSLQCTIVDAVTITYPVTVNPGVETALGTVGWVGAVCSAHGLTIGAFQNLSLYNTANTSGFTPVGISTLSYVSRVDNSPLGGGSVGVVTITTSSPHGLRGSFDILLAGVNPTSYNGTWPGATVTGPNTIAFEAYGPAFATANPLPTGGTVSPVLSFNGTYPCTIISTTAYTFPMPFNVGIPTAPGQVNNPNCAQWSITYHGTWIKGYN